jgi:transcriptional regulator with XRE-family HTH domain
MIGERLKALRAEANMSQEKLADRIHVSAAMISKYENNKATPIDDNIAKLAEELHTTTDYLLGISNEMHPVNYPILQHLPENDTYTLNDFAHYLMYRGDDRTRELLDLWGIMSDQQRERHLQRLREDLDVRH